MARGFLSDGSGIEKADLADVDCEIKRETEKAWLVSDGRTEVWIPKSQAERFPGGLTMPMWLALDKGLC